MKKTLHLIYIPGLGDVRLDEQRRAVRTWHWWRVGSELFDMKWTDNGAWSDKLSRLLARIDELVSQGKKVALVGASAGAAAAIIAFAERRKDLVGIVCVAGKVNHPETVHPYRFRTNPAFKQAIFDCQRALQKLNQADRQHILSRYALYDEVVKTADSRVPGARNRRVLAVEHGLTIALQITIGAPGFIRFLKRQAKD